MLLAFNGSSVFFFLAKLFASIANNFLTNFPLLKKSDFLTIPLRCDSSSIFQSASFLFSEHSKRFVLSFLPQLLMSYKVMLHPDSHNDIGGPHSGVAEDSSLLGCDAVSLDE
jgi:hypothetical protein